MNIFPKNVFNGQNSDGSTFTMREWDFGTLATLQGFGFIIALIFMFVLCSIASPILVVMTLIAFNGKPQINNLLGIGISTYFLIDCYHNWLGASAIYIFCDDAQMRFIIAINIIALIIHLLLLLGSSIIHKMGGYILIIIVGVIFSFGVVKSMAKKIDNSRLNIIAKEKTL